MTKSIMIAGREGSACDRVPNDVIICMGVMISSLQP
jgi:hypothetical protein